MRDSTIDDLCGDNKDPELYAFAEKCFRAGQKSMPLRRASEVLSVNIGRIAIACGCWTIEPTRFIYCVQDDGLLIEGKLVTVVTSKREVPSD